MRIGGHLRTVGALARRRARPAVAPPSREWHGSVGDLEWGPVRLTGRLSLGRPDRLIVAVHGLGGSAESLYLLELAAAADRAGWSILRLNLRGADRRGDDFYHAGLTADLQGALASSALKGFGAVAIVGYSLGAHTVLRYGTETPIDPRVRALAAVCPPLDLAAGQRALDRRGARIYRRYVLDHIKEIYREVAARREVPVPVAVAQRIETLWDWDDTVISARYGFAGAADYYARASVAPRLGKLAVAALVVASADDPMVLAPAVRPYLDPAPDRIEVHWPRRSGHVAFPRRLDLGFGGEKGLAGQLIAWLEAQLR